MRYGYGSGLLVWCDEAWAELGGSSSSQRPGYGMPGGIALHGGSTRRRHAAGRPRVVQNPHSARCVGGIRHPDGCDLLKHGQGWLFVVRSGGFLGSSGGCNGGNCSIRGATRRRHAVTGLLVLPNPHARGWRGGVGGRWGAFRFLMREPIVVEVNVGVTATNGCDELVSHCRGGRWWHNPRLTTLIGCWPLSPFSHRRGRGRVMPFELVFRGANTGQIGVGLRHVSRVRFRLSGGRCGGV